MYSVDTEKEGTKDLRISLCSGCLSFDRKLKTLGEKINVFCMLVSDTYSKFSDISLCWECMAVLRKVELFKEKVDHAQTVLKKSFHLFNTESILPETLSTLAYEKIDIYTNNTLSSPTNCYNDLDLEVKEEIEETIGVVIEPKAPIEAIQSDCLAESFSNDSDNDNIDQIQDFISENSNIDEIQDSLSENSNIDQIQDSMSENSDIDETQDCVSEKSDDSLNQPLAKRLADARRKRKRKEKKKDPDFVPEENRPKDPKNANDEKHTGQKMKDKYTKVAPKEDDINHSMKKITVDTAEWLACLEKNRNSDLLRNIKSKCEKCALPMKPYTLEGHKTLHVKNSRRKFFCDVCEKTFKSKLLMRKHHHRYLHQCVVCDTRTCTIALMKHHLRSHYFRLQCNNCKLMFPSRSAFFKHYRDMHSKFICDYCGRSRSSKSQLIRHISRHGGKYCKKCNKFLKHYNAHVKMYHTMQKTEEAFCVECNKQFRNVPTYKQHLLLSRAHNPDRNEKVKQERHECPDCPNVYCTKNALSNHHDYVHKGDSRHKCSDCNRQFLSSSRLKYHTERIHMKLKPPKNKMCSICGRGFSTNKILIHHIRTHTGERPHHCPHCDASFAQSTAMKTHIKNIHLKGDVV